MKKILFPVDTHEVNAKTLEMAAKMAKSFEAEIVVAHTLNHPGPLSHPQLATMLELEDQRFRGIAEQIIADVSEAFKKAGIDKVSGKVLEGDPASQIVDYAEDEGFDMIVMCTHGMGPVKRFLVGSVTNKVVHHAKVPVLVVRDEK